MHFLKVVRSAAIALLFSQLMTAPLQRAAAAGSDTFHFKVCNTRIFSVFLAVRYNSDGVNYVTHGWWVIEPHTCQEISDFRTGDFYLFAQTFNKIPTQVFVVSSDTVKICVEVGAFTYSGDRACGQADIRDFSHMVVSKPTVTWTL